MVNYKRSYYDLEFYADIFSKVLLGEHQLRGCEFPNIKKIHWGSEVLLDSQSRKIQNIMVGFGAVFFGLKIEEALLSFRSNRYFIDALKIDLLPSIEDYNYFVSTTECEFDITWKAIESELYAVVNYLICDEIQPIHIDFDGLEENGYLIIPDVLDSGLCDELRSLTMSIASHESRALGRGYMYGSGRMQRIYSLVAKHTLYQQLILHPVVAAVMNHMFYRETFHEKYYLTSFHANLLFPGCEKQIWHVDANVPEPLPPWIIRSNSNYIIEDYTKDIGATEIIPGSHKWLRKPDKAEAEGIFASSEVKYIEAPKGSLAFWHGHLWHRSGANVTDKTRIALLGAYAASFFREVSMEENPFLNLDLNQISAMDPKVKNILGFFHGAKFYH